MSRRATQSTIPFLLFKGCIFETIGEKKKSFLCRANSLYCCVKIVAGGKIEGKMLTFFVIMFIIVIQFDFLD